MCGITGMLLPDRLHDGARLAEDLGRMCDTLVHRGPDAGGTWIDAAAGIALGHRRLSILDLSPAGAQPMHSKCGRYVIVFNGEIYNFSALRHDREAAGARFAGHSDTEVLLEGIAAWGLEATLERSDGMFAIALWDRTARRLQLARDRIGEKPLYYGWHGGVFLFASELKALHARPGFRPEIDRDALTLYLRHNYIPEPHCIYRGFRKLVPGTSIAVAAGEAGRTPEPKAYWSLAAVVGRAARNPYTGTPDEGIAALDRALRASVKERMVADVPLGAFLSGGIDSSTVVALMQAESTRPVRTFSIGFDEAEYDEAPHARRIARHLGTDHTELYVTAAEAQAVIPQLSTMYDEPFADSSQIPTFLVSQLARRHVTVAMSGDAGDELFAGYSRYSQAIDLWRRLNRVPSPVRALGAATIRAVAPAQWDRLFAPLRPLLPPQRRYRSVGDKLHKFAPLLAIRDPQPMYLRLISLWDDPASVVLNAREPATVHAAPFAGGDPDTFVAHMMYLDSVHYLPGDILCKVDRASMAVSLEARVPLLDIDVVELAWRMPHAWKVHDGEGKWILRRVLERYVPRALFDRPKMGFGVPIDRWLRGPLRNWAEALLDEHRLRAAGYFRPAPIRAAWQAHLHGEQNLQYMLWGILMFEAWRDRWGH